MTLEQTLKSLKSALTGKSAEAEAFAKELAAVNAKNETLAAEASELRAQVAAFASVQAERDAYAAKVAELEKSLAAAESLKSQAIAQIETVGKKAAKIVASVGVAPVEISAADNVQSMTPAEAWDKYCTLTDPREKAAFYNTHQKAIYAHLGVK